MRDYVVSVSLVLDTLKLKKYFLTNTIFGSRHDTLLNISSLAHM